MRRAAIAVALLCASTSRAHSWLDCVDYDCPDKTPGAGPQSPNVCTCKGFPRNWANVMAGVPFAADRGRDNRPGASPAAGGLQCDAGKEPDPGPGTTIPAGLYSAQYPAATLAAGQLVRWRWPAKNHAKTPNAGTVEVYIAGTPNTGDTFTAAQPYAGQMDYSSGANYDCLGRDQDTDTADCQGTWTVPTTLSPGRYSIMWWWEFNAGEFYNSCADVMITAAAAGPGAGGDGGGGVIDAPPGGGGSQPPASTIAKTRVSFTADGAALTDFTPDVLTSLRAAFASLAGVPLENVIVNVGPLSFASDDYTAAATNGYTPLAEVLLVTADLTHATESQRIAGEIGLRNGMPSAAATSTLLALAGVTAAVRETPVVAAIDADASTEAPADDEGGGGGSGATIAVVVVIFVVAAAAGGYFFFAKGSSAKPKHPVTYAISAAQGIQPPPPPGGGDLPPGWSQYIDPSSGRPYYTNSATGETTWDHPSSKVDGRV